MRFILAFEKDFVEEGVEITVRVTKQEFEILKYARQSGYDLNSGHKFSSLRPFDSAEELIRKLLYWEIMTLRMHSGEVEKFRWNLLLEGKDPNINLRETNPELFIKSGGIVRDKKIPLFKPRFPALLNYNN
jgi:hypothetical protein